MFNPKRNASTPIILNEFLQNQTSMIEIMKTTEVNIKMDERLQVTEKTADD